MRFKITITLFNNNYLTTKIWCINKLQVNNKFASFSFITLVALNDLAQDLMNAFYLAFAVIDANSLAMLSDTVGFSKFTNQMHWPDTWSISTKMRCFQNLNISKLVIGWVFAANIEMTGKDMSGAKIATSK